MRGRTLLGLLMFAIAPFVTGCASSSNTAKGAGLGAALGAGTGALIGKASNGKAGQGALIGGALGAVAGGAIGNDMDHREKEISKARMRDAEARAAQEARQLGIQDVVRMTQEKQSDEIIINQIRTTNSTYQLTADDLSKLRTDGVSDRVVMEMQNRRPEMYPRARYVQGPVLVAPPPPPGAVYVLPPPPPPVVTESIGVGVRIR